jgi:site-specific DNA recombinase
MKESNMGDHQHHEPAVIYGRYSTQRQDPRSIEDQFRRCEEYASVEGFTIVGRYKDEAISGCRQDRPGLDHMVAAIRKRPLPFLHVLVDDSSRLSRDDIDAKTIVFWTLRAVGVVVHDVSSGVRSDDENAELVWGIKGIVDAQYVRDLRKKTHRGLEGRALARKHTGGRCFGYDSVPEQDPANPEHPCSVLRVNEDQAKLVRRIFDLYAAGKSLGAIVEMLNREGIPAPYDGKGYLKPTGSGWAKNQVTAMLRNERYIGKVVWNRHEFYRDPFHGSAAPACATPPSGSSTRTRRCASCRRTCGTAFRPGAACAPGAAEVGRPAAAGIRPSSPAWCGAASAGAR